MDNSENADCELWEKKSPKLIGRIKYSTWFFFCWKKWSENDWHKYF